MTPKDDQSDNNRWRDKYLSALDEQELQEKRFAEQLGLLQRALVRVSVAADGQSPALDRALEALRQQLRQEESTRLPEALAALDEALMAFEAQRQVDTRELRQALEQLLDTLSRQAEGGAHKKNLRDLSRDIGRERDLLQVCPQLLQRLAVLQRQILRDEPSPDPPGLLSRWLGKTEKNFATTPEESSSKPDRAVFELNPNASLRDSETVSLQLRSIITELLASVEAQALAPEDVQQLQQRLQEGISNADLIPVLEQVRDLVMAAYVAATRAYAQYLNQVDTELADIYGSMGAVASQSQALEQASDTLQADMLQQVSTLQTHVTEARDLKTLQHQVQEKLGGIRAVLDSFQRSASQDQPLHQQLEVLASRLQTMEQAARENREILEQQRHKALHDPLTGMPNREAFNERMEQELVRCKRYGNSLTLAVCDLDYFKKINDSLGHQAGDRVLTVLSGAIAKRLREVDFFGRYGGEEFVIILPETTAEQAFTALDKIRAAIAKTDFRYRENPVELTMSVGIAQYRQSETPDQLFARADKALYAAKAAGRNQCMIAESISEPQE